MKFRILFLAILAALITILWRTNHRSPPTLETKTQASHQSQGVEENNPARTREKSDDPSEKGHQRSESSQEDKPSREALPPTGQQHPIPHTSEEVEPEDKPNRSASYRVRVVDGDGQPVPGLEARIKSSATLVFEEEGHLLFTNLHPARRHGLTLQAPGFQDLKHRFKSPKGVASKQVTLTMKPGYVLSGRVTDEDGQPIPVQITAYTSRTQADEQGVFRLEGLPEEVDILAENPEHSSVYLPSVLLDHHQPLIMPPRSLFKAQLVEEETGRSITTFQYRLSRSFNNRFDPRESQFGEWKTVENPDGILKITDLHEGMHFNLSIQAEGYRPLELDPVQVLSSREARDQVQTIEMTSARFLKGRVFDTKGNPIPHVWVGLSHYTLTLNILRQSWEDVMDKDVNGGRTRTGPNGHFSLPLPAQSRGIELYLKGEGLARLKISNVHLRDLLEPLTLVMEKEARIVGRCNLERWPKGELSLEHLQQKDGYLITHPDDQGLFEFKNLASGSYRLFWDDGEPGVFDRSGLPYRKARPWRSPWVFMSPSPFQARPL